MHRFALVGSACVISLLVGVSVGGETPPKSAAGGGAVPRAVGDGVADDTAALQGAVDAGAGDLRLPRGVYRITRPLVFDLDKVGPASVVGSGTARIVMEGPGPAIRFIGTHQGTADPESVKPEVWARQRMPLVDGIEIVGGHDESDGIEATGTMQIVITRVNIRNVRHAVHLVGRNRNVIVSDCHLYHNRGVGLYLDDVDLHQINVGTSHISYNAAGGIVVRAGNVRNLQVSGCDIEANMSADGPSAANVLIDCTEGAAGCAEVAIVGCTIQHTHSAKGSANVRYLAADPKGRTWGNVTIADNVLSDVERNIDIHHARGVSITGNTLWTGVEHDIVIEDSSNVVIGPNVFDRNPPYRDEKTAANGVLLRNCTDVTLTGLHVNGVRRVEAGVILEGCRRANISGCTILDCDNAGLLLRNVSDSRVSGCLMRDDRPDAPPWTPLRMIDCRGVVADELPKGESAVPAGPKDSASPGDR